MTQLSEKSEVNSAHILVAEDDIVVQMVVKKILEQAGYTMDLVVDGVEVITAMEAGHYDLVLMDCLMPRMNGFEATREIRNANPERFNPETPVIAMTGLTEKEDQRRCLDAGMQKIVSKPFDSQSLIPVIQECLTGPEDSGLTPGSQVTVGNETWDDSFFDSVIDKFLKEVPHVIDDLQQAVGQGDASALRNIAHRLKGATDILKVSGLSARSRAVEEAARTGENQLAVTHATELIEELQRLTTTLTE